MKFHCDRCKTKYSISDDRVRGKILKIRCKNCSGVITVREPGAAATPAAAQRTKSAAAQQRATTRRTSTAGQQALAGAFKKAVNDPASSAANMRAASSPASLDAEWYLSKDGEQEGPFTMEQAREWVSGKSPDDELYCWSDGYDDWLPIEKVSHFRGIGTRTFCDLDASDEQTMIGGPAFVDPVETPKPLFAATMAAVADSQSMPLDDEVELPPAASAPLRPAFVAPPIPGIGGLGSGARSGLAAAAAASPMPVPGVAPMSVPEVAPAATPAPSADLDIGEASRVVDLAALMASRGNAPSISPSGSPLPGAGRPFGTGSGTAAAINGATPMMPLLGATAELPHAGVLEAARKKRNSLLLPLIGAGAVIAIGAGVLVVFMMSGSESGRVARGSVGGSGNLGYSFADTRPGPKGVAKPGVETPEAPRDVPTKTRKTRPRRPNGGPGTGRRVTRDPDEVDLSGTGNSGPTGPLDAEDLRQVYRKNEVAVKMCYERSLKKDPLLKVPKTWVDIRVGLNGKVTTVKIPSLAGTPLGTCLVQRISRWKFHPTTEIFATRFPVVFGR